MNQNFDPWQVSLAWAIQAAINDLVPELYEVVDLVFQKVRQSEPLVLAEIADELDLSYATCYERLGRGLDQIAKALIDNPEVADWLSFTEESDDETNIVARLLRAFRS